MRSPEQNDLLLRGLKGELNHQEKEQLDVLLAMDPALKTAWEEEFALNDLLGKIPDAPISSNFTSLVMQAVHKKPAPSRAPAPFVGWLRHGVARVAVGLSVVLVSGLLLYHNYQQAQQQKLATGLATFTALASSVNSNAPAVEVFQNFEAIQRLAHLPQESELDMELLVALQK